MDDPSDNVKATDVSGDDWATDFGFPPAEGAAPDGVDRTASSAAVPPLKSQNIGEEFAGKNGQSGFADQTPGHPPQRGHEGEGKVVQRPGAETNSANGSLQTGDQVSQLADDPRLEVSGNQVPDLAAGQTLEIDDILGPMLVSPARAPDPAPQRPTSQPVAPSAAPVRQEAPGAPDSGPCGPPLAGALSMAARGFRVFPLSPGSKKPPEGFKWKALATTDAATIRSWAAEYPGCNFGVRSGQGLIVLDPDGEAGRSALAELEAKHGKLPETLAVRTPGGGLHIYLNGADVSNARGALPKGIDVRCAGGYVVAPGSHFADSDGAKGYTGPYTIERAAPVADAPDWLPGLLRAAPVSQRKPDAKPAHEMDRPEDIDRAIRYLQNEATPATGGQGGDQRTYDVACEIRDFGISEDTACQLMLEHYDPRCEPPWGEEGIAIKVGNAFTYAQNPIGSKSTAAMVEAFSRAFALDQIEGASDPHGRTSRFFSAADFAGKPVPPREWVVEGLVPFRTVTSLYGDGGLGKTLLAQQLAVAVATGTPWLGRPIMPGRIIFLTAEDDKDELHRRFADILEATGLTFGDLGGLTVRSLAGEDALLATEDKLALTRTALFHELDARAADEGPVLVVIDTLADVYPSNENERVKVRQFIGILRGLALKRSCSVLLLAHPSLTGMSTGSGAGGSTAWNNSVRSRLYLTRAATPDGLPTNHNRRVLETMKANYGPTGETIALTWQDGVFVVDEGAIGGLDGEARAALAERVFLDLLRLHTAQGRHVNPTSGPNYAPKVFAEHPDSQGVHKKGFSAAMERLFKEGTLRTGQRGPQSRPVNFIEEVPK